MAAFPVVEVKKRGEDLDSVVSQGLSYAEWLFKYRERLKPRITQLGWDVDINNIRLIDWHGCQVFQKIVFI